MKIVFTTSYASPYRMKFFNQLGSRVSLTVLALNNESNQYHRNSNWFSEKEESFNFIRLSANHDGVLKRFSRIVKVLNDNNFDYIVIGGYSELIEILLIIWLQLHRIKYVLSVDGGFIKTENAIVKWVKKLLISGAESYLCTGPVSEEYLKHYGAKETKICHYHFTSVTTHDWEGYKSRLLHKSKTRERFNCFKSNLLVSVGRIAYGKGFDILLQSIPLIETDTDIIIVGGNPTDELLEIIMDNNITNVKFIEFLNKDDLNHLLAAADVFALATRSDVWGLVINEAMANGLPVVTTKKCVAGLEMVKNDFNGYIIDVDDTKELAKSVDNILKNEDLKAMLSNNSYSISQSYTIENMVLDHVDFFEGRRKKIGNDKKYI